MNVRFEGHPFKEGFNLTETGQALYVYYATQKSDGTITPDMYWRLPRPVGAWPEQLKAFLSEQEWKNALAASKQGEFRELK